MTLDKTLDGAKIVDVPVYEGATGVSWTNTIANLDLLNVQVVGVTGVTAAQPKKNGSNQGSSITVSSTTGNGATGVATPANGVPLYNGSNGASQANQRQGAGYYANWQTTGTAQSTVLGQTSITARDGKVPADTAPTPVSNNLAVDDVVSVTFTGTPDNASEDGTLVGTAVNNKELVSDVATLTTDDDHGLAVGDRVQVDIDDSVFNGVFTVASVPTTKTFTYALTHNDVTSASATGSVYVDPPLTGYVRFICDIPASGADSDGWDNPDGITTVAGLTLPTNGVNTSTDSTSAMDAAPHGTVAAWT